MNIHEEEKLKDELWILPRSIETILSIKFKIIEMCFDVAGTSSVIISTETTLIFTLLMSYKSSKHSHWKISK